MENKYRLQALSQDLKRVALAFHRGSFQVALRFQNEALDRCSKIDISGEKPYLKKVLKQLNVILNRRQDVKNADNILMYSTLIQNYTTVK
jgi:hypothetical protein